MGKRPGDRFTEATASADYLIARGVPDGAILREVQGTTTWESLAATARILRNRGLDSVLVVSDPYHSSARPSDGARLGLDADASPTLTSPMSGWSEWKRCSGRRPVWAWPGSSATAGAAAQRLTRYGSHAAGADARNDSTSARTISGGSSDPSARR